MQFTLVDLWSHMGAFARAIVVAMLAMSTFSLLLMGERFFALSRARRDSRRFAERLAPLLSQGDIDGAAQAKLDEPLGPLGRVISAGLGAYRTAPHDDADFSFESVARALERQAEREVHSLKRGHAALATISSTAPFVGLLGTVVGIVNSFQMMAASGSGGLGTVSGGISEALVTTALGLLVAIPAVAAYNTMQSSIDARAVDISESSNELLDLVGRRLRTGRVRHSDPVTRSAMRSSIPAPHI